jgi:hypothetical protein
MAAGQMTPEQVEKLLNGPALKPPPGHTPQFENPPNENYIAYVVVTLCLAFATFSLAGRLVVRRRFLYISDYVALASFAFYVAVTYFLYRLTAHSGFFVHQYDIRLRDTIDYTLPIFINTHLYICSITLIRVAIILEWIRIFSGTMRDWYFWVSHLILWTSVIWSSIALILLNLSLIPHKAIYDRRIVPTGMRVDTADTNLAGSSLNIIYDIMLLLLPQQRIWSLHMRKSKKIGLSFIFAFGLFGIGCGAARLDASVSRKNSKDFIYSYSRLFLWAYAEMTCGFMVFSLPSLPKAVEGVKPGILFSALRVWGSASLKWLRRTTSSETAASKTSQASSRPSGYRKFDDPELPLADMGSVRSEGGLKNSGRYLRDDSDVEAGIVRTTDFVTSEGISTGDGRDVVYAQHPWAAKKQ